MLDQVDIDEKWWFITGTLNRYIIVAGEETPPEHFFKHKTHITKVMRLTVMARLRQYPNTKKWWDSKVT